MNQIYKCFQRSLVMTSLAIGVAPQSLAADKGVAVQSRVFFQDSANATLYWADITAGDNPTLSTPELVEGFPKLDSEKQSLVQMRHASGMLMVGVRDEEDGEFQSGWVLIDTGVREEEHGDHSHWYYEREPAVRASMLDDSQGNPAHMYCYDGVFYLANDSKNGFTRLDPASIESNDNAAAIQAKAAFHAGGGDHITLAVCDGVAVSTWAGRDGENAGRIDVTPVSASGAAAVQHSFPLGYSGLHGATAVGGKFFFAPSDGICWVDSGQLLKTAPNNVKVHHLDLGKDGDVPRRTGSFTDHADHVLFVSGKGEATSLGIVHATDSEPEVQMISIPVKEGSRASGPIVIKPRKKTPLAFVFHDHAAGVDAANVATVFELDPNGDGMYADAKTSTQIDVGNSAVVGHSGHHDLAADAGGSFAWITNPGDQSLSVLSLKEMKIIGTHKLPCTPGHLLSIGGRGKKL